MPERRTLPALMLAGSIHPVGISIVDLAFRGDECSTASTSSFPRVRLMHVHRVRSSRLGRWLTQSLNNGRWGRQRSRKNWRRRGRKLDHCAPARPSIDNACPFSVYAQSVRGAHWACRLTQSGKKVWIIAAPTISDHCPTSLTMDHPLLEGCKGLNNGEQMLV